MTPKMKFCLTAEAFCLCLQTVECLWQNFNDSTSAAFWQASLAMDETNNSKSTVKSSLTSQDQTFHLNISLGRKWGSSQQLRIWHDNREESALPQEHLCVPSAWQTQAHKLVRTWLSLAFCFKVFGCQHLNISSMEGNWGQDTGLKVG